MRLFPMNLGQTRMRLVQAGAVFTAVALIAGCGSAYRSVITPITSTGPAAQPTSYAAVVSSPSATASGIATIIDYSGDTIMASQAIGVAPAAFAISNGGSYGYTINGDKTLTTFPISSTFQEKNVLISTLPTGADPISLFFPSTGLWAADPTNNWVDVFTGSAGSAAAYGLSVSVATAPVTVIGPGTVGQRDYAISQGFTTSGTTKGVECNTSPQSLTQTGYVTPIEVSSNTADSPITVGVCPVYGVLNSAGTRLFVLNRGSDTISVINTQTAALDTCSGLVSQTGRAVTCHPTLPLSTTAVTKTGITPVNGTSGMTSTAGPVQAEYNTATEQLVVANYDGGTISIIDVSLDEYGNDSDTFGTTYTVPVGTNPAAVTVLYDGSRAYTANQADETVSIVNLSGHTVEKTLDVVGYPRNVASTQNSSYGKVYVASPNSDYVTIINTATDLVSTTVLVEGNVVDVRVSTQNAVSGNANQVTRKPGYGQPCNMPGSTYSATLTACTAMPY
jgi:YVTN family beta-propeller protein